MMKQSRAQCIPRIKTGSFTLEGNIILKCSKFAKKYSYSLVQIISYVRSHNTMSLTKLI